MKKKSTPNSNPFILKTDKKPIQVFPGTEPEILIWGDSNFFPDNDIQFVVVQAALKFESLNIQVK